MGKAQAHDAMIMWIGTVEENRWEARLTGMQKPDRSTLRNSARFLGMLWMIGAVVAGLVLIGSGLFRGGRGQILILFGATLPGVFIYRWGRGIDPRPASIIKPRRLRPIAPIDMTAESGHVLKLNADPIKTLEEGVIPSTNAMPAKGQGSDISGPPA